MAYGCQTSSLSVISGSSSSYFIEGVSCTVLTYREAKNCREDYLDSPPGVIFPHGFLIFLCGIYVALNTTRIGGGHAMCCMSVLSVL